VPPEYLQSSGLRRYAAHPGRGGASAGARAAPDPARPEVLAEVGPPVGDGALGPVADPRRDEVDGELVRGRGVGLVRAGVGERGRGLEEDLEPGVGREDGGDLLGDVGQAQGRRRRRFVRGRRSRWSWL
jgi:hypothetical protein